MVCTGMVLVPAISKPVISGEDAEASQVKVVPWTLEVNVTGSVGSPEQWICSMGVLVTDGAGLTVIT